MGGRIFNMFVLISFLAAAMLHGSSAQTTHIVGDALGWLVPPGGEAAYRTWAASKTFTVGDILVFNFTENAHDVAEVTKESFDSCNTTNPLSLSTTSLTNITLNSTGEHHFICTFQGHCGFGQKLAINVSAALAPQPAATPPPQAAPAPGPSRVGMTYTVGDSLGWLVPPGGPAAYQTWARGKSFMVGDILVFNFTSGAHDVLEVTRAEFDSCNVTATSSPPITTTPARITLTSAGEHYYICTFSQHCTFGQKLAINVSAALAPQPAATPPPQAAPAPGPSRVGMTYTVGDSLGWLVPPGGPAAYQTWARGKSFMVGDILVFNFTSGAHDVLQVTRAEFDSCNVTATSSPPITATPARITLTSSGEHYYICTFSQHCTLGQKLAINVTGGGAAPAPAPLSPASTPSSSTTPPPTSSTPPPTSGGPTPSTPSTPSTPGPMTPPPPPSSAAPSVAVAALPFTVLAVAVAFFH